jgi:excinuclease ABC subunit C
VVPRHHLPKRKSISMILDNLLQSLVFSYYQNNFSLPEKLIFTVKPQNLNLIGEAIKLKFNQPINISCSTPSSTKQFVKLAIFNANQVIDNKIVKSEKYDHAMKNLSHYLGLHKTKLLIEGYDISHHAGKYAVASSVKFSNQGPEKKSYKLYNIPAHHGGNDIGSLEHVLKRRVNRAMENSLPDIILIDGGKAQLNSVLKVFRENHQHQPVILSIVKGANRVRATETILSEQGILEIPVNSPAFNLLQQIRDESHRFAISSNRKKKNQSIRYSLLDKVSGLGPAKKRKLLKHFKSLKKIKAANVEDLCMVEGISIKLALNIKKFLNHELFYSIFNIF